MTEPSTGQGKVSIVIPCYNHGAMLREAVASIEQVRNTNPLEVITVDDGSGRWYVPDFNLLSLIRMNFIDVCALYRKKLWQEVGGYDEQMPWMGLEDWDFWLRVASHGGSFFTFQRFD